MIEKMGGHYFRSKDSFSSPLIAVIGNGCFLRKVALQNFPSWTGGESWIRENISFNILIFNELQRLHDK